jgi:hypothetical protein
VARGFPVLADNHVQHAVVAGLLSEGWDVIRAIDVFPEGTGDEVQDYAAMTTGDVLRTFARLAAKEKPFAYPIQFVTPPGTRTERRERFKRSRRPKR